jgi:mycothiol synthase
MVSAVRADLHAGADHVQWIAVRVRAPDHSDAPAVLDLIVARDIADLGRPDYTLEDVRADWAAPGVDPALDAWLVEDGDGPLGYALLDDRGAALVTVPPASEGRGVGTALREAAEARAIDRGEALLRQYVPTANEAARTHLLDAGYWPARSYFRMRMELAEAPAPPSEVPVRAFDRGTDDGPVHALVEEAMAGVPGNEPRSLESWQAAKVDKEGWDPSLWLLHEDADGLSGVVLCERWEDGLGYVDYLAVASRSRGRGLGRAMLLHGLAALRAAGLTVAELSVQGENAGATRLYESVGMRPLWTIERWEKPLRPM